MAKELRLPRINSVIISGRLTRDVDLRYTPNGTPVAKLSLAFDRNYQKDGEWLQETSYIDVVVWNKRGEQCAEFLHKGSPVLIEGRLQTRSYENNEGRRIKITEVIANRTHFLERAETIPESDEFEEKEPTATSEKPEATVTDDDVPF
ncbi:MAG: hypothetical protein B6D62_01955 [Candidatus Cloacimonas sp. 4484_275]|nr:MAG: hypothetical protein B6D62_01955 [Candidatus Cloacimonas sp. 4484_275]RLC50159.1 MAG: single-stranded DNA-binding protein [Candidatus Cloacimonadota bacterium]